MHIVLFMYSRYVTQNIAYLFDLPAVHPQDACHCVETSDLMAAF